MTIGTRIALAALVAALAACGADDGGGSAGSGGGGSSGSGGTGGEAGSGGAGGEGGAAPIGDWQDGIATFYDTANGTGACSFAATTDVHVAALNNPQFENAAWCGACAEVEGPLGTTVVRIVDLCPECQAGHLDLHPGAFDEVANRIDGRVDIQWRFVSCDVAENVGFRLKEGSSQWWTAVQVVDHRLPIRKLEWWNGEAWIEVPRQPYNYFVAETGMGPGPWLVRITAIDDQTLEATIPSDLQPGAVYRATAQFE